MRKILLLAIGLLFITQAKAQLLKPQTVFTRADTLRGMLSPLRSCYNVNYYHLNVKVNINDRHISGSTLFKFTATQEFQKLQFDLFQNFKIEKILYRGIELAYKREFNAVFLQFPMPIKSGTQDEFIVHYSGSPIIAKNAPWEGGFVFSKDKAGKPWVAVACQGMGASSWWPTKDHQSDEPDSMLISITVPPGLMNVSNGRLRSTKAVEDNYTTYNWFVSYPINNYCVTLNIGDYAHISDEYTGLNGKLSLDYYVLKQSEDKAREHFKSDVKPMLNAFEYWFGPYPFYRDGYKLVETPYLGLENQTAIAYGNQFKKGYKGFDWSGTGLGLTWDYIIIHESGHEWFGNNITTKDIADMWVHESFTTYSESLFIESKSGKGAAAQYIKGERKNIKNDASIIGTYHVNKEGSGDMYFKGTNILHTVRSIINDDTKWQHILQGLNKTFGLKTTTTEEVVNYISKTADNDLTKVFDQYLRYKDIPLLEIKKMGNNSFQYRWIADIKDFEMPIRIQAGKSWKAVSATTSWKTLESKTFIPDTDNFYIKTKFLTP